MSIPEQAGPPPAAAADVRQQEAEILERTAMHLDELARWFRAKTQHLPGPLLPVVHARLHTLERETRVFATLVRGAPARGRPLS